MSKHYDPMMHSAEHLLNQAMVRTFDCGRCFSAHINRKKSKCDYRFDRPLTDREVIALEKEVNAQIQNNLKVTTHYLPVEAANEAFDLGRVPDKKDLDTIRVVCMGDYDRCPCIGPHVGSTGEIGQFRITGTGFDDGVLRIRFKLKRA